MYRSIVNKESSQGVYLSRYSPCEDFLLPMSAPIHSSALICKHSLGFFEVTYVGVLPGLFEVVYVCAPRASSRLHMYVFPGLFEVVYVCASRALFGGIHFFEDSVHDKGCKEEGTEVGDGLGDLDSQKTEDWCQDQ